MRTGTASDRYKVSMLGAGNVATHLSGHLQAAGHKISCIYSRSREPAAALAGQLGCPATTDPNELPADSDFYILCLPDRAVAQVAEQFRDRGGIWLHTSGALPAALFRDKQEQYGVLYPLQTLSRERRLSLKETPILVEGSAPQVTGRIRKLAQGLSGRVVESDHQNRLIIHLAAVFASNFSNHMVSIAQSILAERGIDPGILDPLVRETFGKLSEMKAASAQTGPAVRGDEDTMDQHLELLAGDPEWEKIYTFISRDIKRRQGDDQF